MRAPIDPEASAEFTQASLGSPAVARPHPLPFSLLSNAEKQEPYAATGAVAVLFNQRAHRNAQASGSAIARRPFFAAPETKADLDQTLAEFARAGIGTLVIAGGDGTVRDVLSRAPRHFGGGMPRLVIAPSGKTNALAKDLGIRGPCDVEEVLSALPGCRTVRRAPMEIRYGQESEPRLRGFFLGTGAFVRGTRLAQSVHRAGAFNGIAVALATAGALRKAMFGAETNEWRRGEAVTLELHGRAIEREFCLLLCSTLERMPLGIRPFGPIRPGLKLLGVDAPARRALFAVFALAFGSQRKWLSDYGYKRTDADSFRLRMEGDFILDGEAFPGGDLTIAKGIPIDFLVPG